LGDLLARFRDHTPKLFERHGLENVAYWTPTDDPEKDKTLIYILRHPSREAAAKNWKSFQDDPEWKSVKEKSEANGPLVEKIDSTYMVMTDFSPQGLSRK
jgi:NIPSNAP